MSPQLEHVLPVRSQPPSAAVSKIASGVADSLHDGPTAVVLDLEPILGVHVAAELNCRRLAHPVLVLPRWPYAKPILPVDKLLSALITQSRRLSISGERLPNVVFVLDADRSKSVARPRSDPRVDNRYRLTAADLPSLAALTAGGIRRVIKVSHA